MGPRRLIAFGVLAMSLVVLAGCYEWVERLEIVVREDLSGNVSLVVLESYDDIEKETVSGQSSLDQDRHLAESCGFTTRDYLAHPGADGFVATNQFSDKDELDDSLTCLPVVALFASPHPPSVEKWPWGTSYRLQVDLRAGFMHQVQITLPGRVRAQAEAVPAGVLVSISRVSPDTVLYTISASPDAAGSAGSAASSPQPETTAPSSALPAGSGTTGTVVPSLQPTVTTEALSPPMVLTVRSFQPNFVGFGVLVLLGLLILGGVLVVGARSRRTRARRVAAGLGRAHLKQLHDALLDAFPSGDSLEQMVYFELGGNLQEIAGQGPLGDVVYRLVQWADAEGRLGDLLRSARTANPGNEHLRRLEERWSELGAGDPADSTGRKSP
jgi:hypothetical protein